MWYFIAFNILLLISVMDGHSSSMIALLFLFVLGFWSVNSIKKNVERLYGGKVFGIVFTVYVISAFVASQSFINGQYFYASDSMKYIEDYCNNNYWSWEYTLFSLTKTYVLFADDNGLFNALFSFWSYVANQYFDGTSVFYLTIFLTLFGVLASLEIYKIFTYYFEPKKAANYVCIFAILSLFHIYSVIIIRDIIIAYFYMVGLRRVIGEPTIADVFVLISVMIIIIGIRLYSGLFFGAFIMLWLYKFLQKKNLGNLNLIIIPLITIGILFIGASIVSSVLIEGAEGEVGHYDDLYSVGGGAVSKLRSLPPGVRHIAILFFSQLPLESLQRLSIANSFSNYYLSFLVIFYHIFGFVVFYGLMYFCLFKGYLTKMNFNEKGILVVMLLFISLTQSTHIEVRRSMAAIPFLYLLYMHCTERYNRELWSKVNRSLVVIGLFLMFAYSIV